jgi:2-polyprenyl-3-methyl-5-hydroxy-6-metoxy-1,4-benzoquinol methylase
MNNLNLPVAPKEVCRILQGKYPDPGFLHGLFLRLRPYICPFHEICKYVPENSAVLDIGCGIGIMTVLLASLGLLRKGIGVDMSEEAIRTASSAAIPRHCDVSFHFVEREEQWPTDGPLDVIICIDVLHHVPKSGQREFVKRVAEYAKTGRVIFKDISPKPTWKAMVNVLHDLLLCREWISIRDETQVKRWFQEEGFTILEFKRLDIWCYSHYLLVVEGCQREP